MTAPAGYSNVALEARGIYRFYHIGDDETVALSDVSISVGRGEFVALMGPSGSGKSTLLACLTGIEEPDAGFVLVNGVRISRRPAAVRATIRAASLGILLQSGNLFSHLTVRENIKLQLTLAGIRSDSQRLIEDTVDDVGLHERIDAYPTELSGGEAARAGLAIVLAKQPQIIVADEPTAEVDRDAESRILELFAAKRDQGTSIFVATHSERLAARADRIVHLWDGRVRNA